MKLIPIVAFGVAVAAQSVFAEDLPPACQHMVDYFSACSAEVNQALQATGTDTSKSGWPTGSAVSKEAHAALAKNGAQKQEEICEQSVLSKIDKNLANVGMIVGMSGHQLSDALQLK